MTQRRPMPPPRPPVRKVHTPFRHRVIMAVCGVSIVLVALYFLQGSIFPSDITFKNVQRSEVPYAYLRESP